MQPRANSTRKNVVVMEGKAMVLPNRKLLTANCGIHLREYVEKHPTHAPERHNTTR